MKEKQIAEVVEYLNTQLANADMKWNDPAVDRSHIVGFLEGSIQHAIILLGGEINK